jgi:hypothetical protein
MARLCPLPRHGLHYQATQRSQGKTPMTMTLRRFSGASAGLAHLWGGVLCEKPNYSGVGVRTRACRGTSPLVGRGWGSADSGPCPCAATAVPRVARAGLDPPTPGPSTALGAGRLGPGPRRRGPPGLGPLESGAAWGAAPHSTTRSRGSRGHGANASSWSAAAPSAAFSERVDGFSPRREGDRFRIGPSGWRGPSNITDIGVENIGVWRAQAPANQASDLRNCGRWASASDPPGALGD